MMRQMRDEPKTRHAGFRDNLRNRFSFLQRFKHHRCFLAGREDASLGHFCILKVQLNYARFVSKFPYPL